MQRQAWRMEDPNGSQAAEYDEVSAQLEDRFPEMPSMPAYDTDADGEGDPEGGMSGYVGLRRGRQIR